MTPLRVQTRLTTLLASLALSSLPAMAQPGPGPSSPPERVIAISGAPDESPPVLYAAPDAPLVVIFDAPLRKDAAVTVPGAEVRPHPFLPNALFITPSKPLAGQSSVPVVVPMAEGAIALTLAFSRSQRDGIVRIVHRAISAPPAATQDELKELVEFVLGTALDTKKCPEADSTGVPRQVVQASAWAPPATVCGGGALSYVGVTPKAGCHPATARLTRGTDTADVLLVREVTPRGSEASSLLVVARAPGGDGRGFRLELLAEDGTPCPGYDVDLKP